jgi:type II secretory pathway component GspD/PulD (secretin)
VLIKVVFLEVQHNNASEIGVEGSYSGNPLGSNLGQITGFLTNYVVSAVSNGAPSVVPSSVRPIYQSIAAGNNFNLPATVAGAAGNGGLYQVLGNDFTATIQAVAAAGKSQVISRPSILAHDGQMAQIVVGQEIYLPSGVSYASVAPRERPFPPLTAPTRTSASSCTSRRLSATTAWWK